MKKTIMMLLLIFFISRTAFCAGFDGRHELEKSFHKIIGSYWKSREVLYQEAEDGNQELYYKNMAEYNRLCKKIAEHIEFDSFGESYSLENFRELYRSCPEISRPAFEKVLGMLNEKILLANLQGNKIKMIESAVSAEKTEYIYRLGKELERELIKAEWVIERRTYFKNVKVTMVVDGDLVKPLKILYPAIFLLNLGSWLIDGEAYLCYKTTFTTKHKLFFRTVKKLAKNKVWFEVLRAKKTWFTPPKWEVYGKTYRIIEEPTGAELAREMKVLD